MIFRNARILDSSQNLDLAQGDLWIDSGKIRALERSGLIPRTEGVPEKDCSGLWLLPGLVDAHVHFREPGFELKETLLSGSQAAVAGGFTSVACMANTNPVNDHAITTEFIIKKSKEIGLCQVYPIGAVTKGLQGCELADIGSMVSAGAIAISDDGLPVMNSRLMRQAMSYAASFGVPIISHAEDLNLSHGNCMHEGATSFWSGLSGNPAASEEIMVAREIALCRLTHAKLHIAHLSTQLALEHIRRAKEEGLPVTCEVTPHHLLWNESMTLGYETYCKMAPPLRSKEDSEALIQGLADGIIDIIATDHAPHSSLEKLTLFSQAPNGIIGLQTVVPTTLELIRTKKLSLMRWVDSLTSSPARVLGIQAGTLQIGAKADLCLIHPDFSWNFTEKENFSKSKNSPLLTKDAQQRLQALVFETWVSGKVVFQKKESSFEGFK